MPSRRYEQGRGDRTRARLVDAVVAYAEAGRFQPPAKDLAQFALTTPGAINRHFGSVKLLRRVVAREHWDRIFPCLPFAAAMAPLREADARAAVWAVLVGEPRELS